MISTLGELPALPPYRLFRGMMWDVAFWLPAAYATG
jgi:hypothetical protein